LPKIYRGMQTGVIRFQSEVSVLDFPIIKTILEKFKAHTEIIEEKNYDFYDDLSVEDIARLEKSIAQAQKGMLIDSEEVFREARQRIYENKMDNKR